MFLRDIRFRPERRSRLPDEDSALKLTCIGSFHVTRRSLTIKLMKPETCPCGSNKPIQSCCGRWIAGREGAPTAEALMRSRYTAYVLEDAGYLVNTTLPASRTPDLFESIRTWMKQVDWQKLHILRVNAGDRSDTEGTVEFIAEFIGPNGTGRHHEQSLFKKKRGTWYYAG